MKESQSRGRGHRASRLLTQQGKLSSWLGGTVPVSYVAANPGMTLLRIMDWAEDTSVAELDLNLSI